MNYILKHFDTPLLKFSANPESSNPDFQILWQDENSRNLFPLDLETSPEGLNKWISRRAIPKNRAFVHAFLAKCGLNLNRPMSIAAVSKGLSLNDCYWIVEEGFEGTFAQCNLYDNRFSQILAALVFTGYGSSLRSSLLSSPEFTTNGMLPKCWRRINGKILLYKGGTSGASNTGYEPYSEFYAYQVAEALGIHAVSYGLSKWKETLCSTCELFTSKEVSFIPVGRIVKSGGIEAVHNYYKDLGGEFLEALYDMFLLDAVICNTDRHFGNFGFLIDNSSNKISAPAPLFDHGNSLFNFAGRDSWENGETLREYADTLYPCVYDDFIETAKSGLNQSRRQKVRGLLEFRFRKHPRYNLLPKRLKLIEEQIQSRARRILE